MYYLIYDLDYFELFKIFKVVWYNFLVILVLNNYLYKLIILKNYGFLFMNICRISLFLKIDYLKWIKIFFLLEYEKLN